MTIEVRCRISELPEWMCADCRRGTHGRWGRLSEVDLQGVGPEPDPPGWDPEREPFSRPGSRPENPVILAEHDAECPACLGRIKPGHHIRNSGTGEYEHVLCPV